MTSPKLPTKAGVAILAIGGVSVTLTTSTAREWLEIFSQYGPLMLSGWLIYVVYQMDKERADLHKELSELRVKVARLERLEGLGRLQESSATNKYTDNYIDNGG